MGKDNSHPLAGLFRPRARSRTTVENETLTPSAKPSFVDISLAASLENSQQALFERTGVWVNETGAAKGSLAVGPITEKIQANPVNITGLSAPKFSIDVLKR